MSLLRFKKANEKTKHIIHGYSREHQNKSSISLPMTIQYLFLAYYWIQEKFAKYEQPIELYQNNTRADVDSSLEQDEPHSTVYGNHVIDINDTSIKIYKWRFRIIGIGREIPGKLANDGKEMHSCISIGIDSSGDSVIEDDLPYGHNAFHTSENKIYGIDSNWCILTEHKWNWQRELIKEFGRWKDDDIIEIILNVQTKEMSVSIERDGKDKATKMIAKDISFDNIQYNLAVSFQWEYEEDLLSIELADFDIFQK